MRSVVCKMLSSLSGIFFSVCFLYTARRLLFPAADGKMRITKKVSFLRCCSQEIFHEVLFVSEAKRKSQKTRGSWREIMRNA